MALGMQELEARWEQGGVWKMNALGGGVKCSRRGVEPSLSLVAASLSAVGTPLKQLPFHLDKLITESLQSPSTPPPPPPPPLLQWCQIPTGTATC